MEEYKENYIGELVKNERKRRGLSSKAVCSGICSMGVYSKLESGVYAGNVHVLRAVFERLGIDTERSGTYLAGKCRNFLPCGRIWSGILRPYRIFYITDITKGHEFM